MMKARHLLCFLYCSVLLLAAACRPSGGPGESQQAVQGGAAPMHLTEADTTTVTRLAHAFLSRLKEGETAEAAAMLYTANFNDVNDEPQLLDNEELKAATGFLGTLNITAYEVESITFESAYQNRVQCRLTQTDGRTIRLYLHPVRWLGNWRMCLEK